MHFFVCKNSAERYNPYSTEYCRNIINIVVTLQQHRNIAAILPQYSVLYRKELYKKQILHINNLFTFIEISINS